MGRRGIVPGYCGVKAIPTQGMSKRGWNLPRGTKPSSYLTDRGRCSYRVEP